MMAAAWPVRAPPARLPQRHERTAGIGPMVFSTIYPETNTNLAEVADHLWLARPGAISALSGPRSGSAFATCCATGHGTLSDGGMDRPLRPQLIGNVIDTDHWRHHFSAVRHRLGLRGAGTKFQRERSRAAALLHDIR